MKEAVGNVGVYKAKTLDELDKIIMLISKYKTENKVKLGYKLDWDVEVHCYGMSLDELLKELEEKVNTIEEDKDKWAVNYAMLKNVLNSSNYESIPIYFYG